jgi:hypothetical protein
MNKSKKSEISLLEAIAAMKGELDDFQDYWREKSRKEPLGYPATFPALEEWEDQFVAWRELYGSKSR